MAAIPTKAAHKANSKSILPIFKKIAAMTAENTIPKFSAQPAMTLAAVSSWATRAVDGRTADCAGRVAHMAVLATTANAYATNGGAPTKSARATPAIATTWAT